MQRGISYQGFIPIRMEPSPQSTMLSQILFGEHFTILKSEGSWMLVEMDAEQSEGWVDRSSVQLEKEPQTGNKESQVGELLSIHPMVRVRDVHNTRQLLLPAGSIMYEQERFVRESDEGWITPGESIEVETIGKELLSIPGLTGGRSGFGFDAPGLMQFLFKCMGISVPHSISAQALPGSSINFMHETQKGDLAFFSDEDEIFTHVGMVLDEGRILHVTDQVRIDRLDQQGIFCDEKGTYTHRLRVVKSVKS